MAVMSNVGPRLIGKYFTAFETMATWWHYRRYLDIYHAGHHLQY